MSPSRASGDGGGGQGSQAAGLSAIPTVPGRKTLLEFVKETGTKLTIDGEELYRVEGDLLLDEDQLATWAAQREGLARAGQAGVAAPGGGGVISRGLVGILRDGKVLRWQDGLEG